MSEWPGGVAGKHQEFHEWAVPVENLRAQRDRRYMMKQTAWPQRG